MAPPPMTPQNSRSKIPPQIAVIGGGAAGFFAAVNLAEKHAAENGPAAKAEKPEITIFEAGTKPLQKVFISGGGRCNVTHACFDPGALTRFYPRGAKELRSLFSRFQPQDMTAWLTERGLKLKTEADGRIFPNSNQSQDVIDLFLTQARKYNITLKTQHRIEAIQKTGDAFLLTAKIPRAPNEAPNTAQAFKTQTFKADIVILATGYSPVGWQLAKSLGHTIIPPVPSLFPFKVSSPLIQELQGISVLQVKGCLKAGANATQPETFDAEGPILITHSGLSGPCIYRLSALGARALAQNHYQAELLIDWVPAVSEETLRTQLFNHTDPDWQKKKLKNTQLPPLANRLWLSFLTQAGCDLEIQSEHVGKKEKNKLIELLKRSPLPVTGKSPSKEEFVSCGGVALKEVDFRTMESKICPGLYLGGEILDIDGLTGGFNFQACWSAGWAISEAL